MKIKIRGTMLFCLLTLMLMGRFSIGGASANSASTLIFYGEDGKQVESFLMEKDKEVDLNTLTFPLPEVDGKTFLYWTLDDKKVDKIIPKLDIYSLYAYHCKDEDVVKIIPKSSFIKEFYAQRGDTVDVGTIEKEGYNFDGWYLDEGLLKPFDGRVNTDSSTLYVFPKFTKIKFQLKIAAVNLQYNEHIFTADERVIEYEYGENVVLEDLSFSLENHILLGFSFNQEEIIGDFFIMESCKLYPIFERIKFKVDFLGINNNLLFSEEVFIYDRATYNYASENNKYYKFEGWNHSFDEITKDTIINAQYKRLYDKEYFYEDKLINQVFDREDINPDIFKEGCLPAKFLIIEKTETKIIYEVIFDKVAYKILNEPNLLYNIESTENLYYQDIVEVRIVFKNKNYQLESLGIFNENIVLTKVSFNTYRFRMPAQNIRFNVEISEIPKTFILINNINDFTVTSLDEMDFSGLGIGENSLTLSQNDIEVDTNLLPKGEVRTLFISVILSNSLENMSELKDFHLYLIRETKEDLYILTENRAIQVATIKISGTEYYKIPINVGNMQLALVKQKSVNTIGIVVLTFIGMGCLLFLAIKNQNKIKAIFIKKKK